MKSYVLSFGRRGAEILNRHLKAGGDVTSVAFADTDAEDLALRPESMRLHLGAGIPPEDVVRNDISFAAKAALGEREEIEKRIEKAAAVILTAGLGGGTGAGAAEATASICREKGVFTAAVVTRPFGLEGEKRVHRAASGLRRLEKEVGFMIPLFQDSLLSSAEKVTRVRELMGVADEYAANAVEGLLELLQSPLAEQFAKDFGGSSGRGVFGYGMSDQADGLMDAITIALESPFISGVSLSRTENLALTVRAPQPVDDRSIDAAVSLLRERTGAQVNILVARTVAQNESSLRVCVFPQGEFGEPSASGGHIFTPVYQG